MKLEVRPVTPDRWRDFVAVMGPKGAYSGCWCMWWRAESRKTFAAGSKGSGNGNRRQMEKLVDGGVVPGLIAYVDEEPAMWCSIAPREDYGALERSRVYRRVDDKPVWAVVCFHAAKPFRRQGLMAKVLKAACEYARDHGARIVEGYPVDPSKKMAPVDVYMGTAGAFRAAGFREVGRTGNGKPVMRRTMRAKAKARKR